MTQPATFLNPAAMAGSTGVQSFDERFARLFEAQFARLFRFLDRLSGDPDLAADLAQEAFIRLCDRGSMPDSPEAWLVTVALNRFRNARAKQSRRTRLLTPHRGRLAHSDPVAAPSAVTESAQVRSRVRAALDVLSERDRSMLLMHVEGYRYRDIAGTLGINEVSVGTLLARARQAFRTAWENGPDAP